jgi:hypothetical protein
MLVPARHIGSWGAVGRAPSGPHTGRAGDLFDELQPARFAHNGLAGGSSPSSQPTEVPKSLTISTQFVGIFAGSNAGRCSLRCRLRPG